jgi:flavin reductase (DIM6/NTAB) family NADH-FMN oxidoreductase RutF
MEISAKDLSPLEIYKILTGCVLPRPIAWVSTTDVSSNVNLAPFSFFNVASVTPPVLCFSPLLKDDQSEKDTLVNIRQTAEFVVNIVSYDLVEKMNLTSAPYPSGISEFTAAGLTVHKSAQVIPPGVQESLVRFECKLLQIISFGAMSLSGNLVLGQICHIHINEDIYQNGKVLFKNLDAVGRLAGDYYTTIRDLFSLSRPELRSGK